MNFHTQASYLFTGMRRGLKKRKIRKVNSLSFATKWQRSRIHSSNAIMPAGVLYPSPYSTKHNLMTLRSFVVMTTTLVMSALGIDTTFQFGNFYVVTTSYGHPFLQSREGTYPTLFGPTYFKGATIRCCLMPYDTRYT